MNLRLLSLLRLKLITGPLRRFFVVRFWILFFPRVPYYSSSDFKQQQSTCGGSMLCRKVMTKLLRFLLSLFNSLFRYVYRSVHFISFPFISLLHRQIIHESVKDNILRRISNPFCVRLPGFGASLRIPRTPVGADFHFFVCLVLLLTQFLGLPIRAIFRIKKRRVYMTTTATEAD